MSVADRIREAIGEPRSPSMGLDGRPLTVEAGSVEARLSALEHDIARLRDGLIVSGEEVDALSARVDVD